MEGALSSPHVRENANAIHRCAASGKADELLDILHACNNDDVKHELLHRQGINGDTALHLAILYNHKDIAKALVKAGASLTILNEDNHMPISYCCDGDMLHMLLSATKMGEIELGTVDATKRSVVHYASVHLMESESVPLFSRLISQACSSSDRCLLLQDEEGDTFLGTAAKAGNTNALKALGQMDGVGGKEAKRKLVNGDVAIAALMHGHRHFLDQLLALGKRISADVVIGLERLCTELTRAAHKRVDDDAEKEKAWPKAFGAAEKISVESLKKQLEKIGKASLPTYVALYADKDEAFRFLLETGLLTENQCDDEHKRTCLHWALLHKRQDIVRRLVRSPDLNHAMPSPGIKDGTGKTAWAIAFEQHNGEAMEWLKENESRLRRERDVYVQALNGILVGAALIVSVTFESWFQMAASSDDALFGSKEMKSFWVWNSVSFYSAVVAMCVCIAGLLPTGPTMSYVGDAVDQVKYELARAAILLALSLQFLIAGLARTPTSYGDNGRDYATWASLVVGPIISLLLVHRLWAGMFHRDKSLCKRLVFGYRMPSSPANANLMMRHRKANLLRMLRPKPGNPDICMKISRLCF